MQTEGVDSKQAFPLLRDMALSNKTKKPPSGEGATRQCDNPVNCC